MSSLYQRSIDIIKTGQAKSGAYIASPNFPTYQFCWLRDGSFIAHAMDIVGEYSSSEAFFQWVGRTIQKYHHKVENIRQVLEAGFPIGKDDFLHTRYTLDGDEVTVDSSWGNFQIDGYGTWIWGLAEHVHLSGNIGLLKELHQPIQMTLNYLELVWNLPNYDCWEEHPEYIHPYSLATVYRCFDTAAQLAEDDRLQVDKSKYRELAIQVKEYLLRYATLDGCLVKHIFPGKGKDYPHPATQQVDSSLIGVAVPFGVFSADDPLIQNTIRRIEQDLHRPGGGVYRFKADVYYGGGEWLLLAAWLGWYYAKVGNLTRARELRDWIESQADPDGCLPEQVNDHTLAPQFIAPWIQKWGQVAKPLLWSHAMYLILSNAARELNPNDEPTNFSAALSSPPTLR